jgi:branched-chain amino acid transport system permease protein
VTTKRQTRRTPRLVAWTALAGCITVLLLLPQQSSPYTVLQFTLIFVFAVVIHGLNIVTGYSGQVSLGQGAFFGVGAYAAGIAILDGWPIPIAFLAACTVPALVGFLVAIPASRLTSHGLVMLTLALPLVAVPLAERMKDVTGGSNGLLVPVGAAPEWTGLDYDQWAYYVVLVVSAVLFLLAHFMVQGKVGRALALIRTNEVVATSMGIDVKCYKVTAFTIAAAYGGGGGFLYVLTMKFISPESLTFLLGIMLLVGLVVGGLRSTLGSLLAAGFYLYVPSWVGTFNPERTSLFYGVALLVIVFLAPAGIAGLVYGAGRGGLQGAWRRFFTYVTSKDKLDTFPVQLTPGRVTNDLESPNRAE